MATWIALTPRYERRMVYPGGAPPLQRRGRGAFFESPPLEVDLANRDDRSCYRLIPSPRCFLAVVLLLSVSACAPELSRLEGVSIRRWYQQSRLSTSDEQGRHWETGTLATFLGSAHRHLNIVSGVDLCAQEYEFKSPPMRPGSGDGARATILKAIQATFGLSIRLETRELPVQVLSVSPNVPLGLTPAAPDAIPRCEEDPPPVFSCGLFAHTLRHASRARCTFRANSISDTQSMIAVDDVRWSPVGLQHMLIADETNLHGRYDFEFVLDRTQGMTVRNCFERLGLCIETARRPVTALYVDLDPSIAPRVRLKPLRGQSQMFWAWDPPKSRPQSHPSS
jgi:hypothetical protein